MELPAAAVRGELGSADAGGQRRAETPHFQPAPRQREGSWSTGHTWSSKDVLTHAFKRHNPGIDLPPPLDCAIYLFCPHAAGVTHRPGLALKYSRGHDRPAP